MRKHLLAAGLAAATLIPSAALAQQTCEQRQASRVGTAVAGAGIGALLGGAVAGRDDRTKGALIGAAAGGLLASQLNKGAADCAKAYGYYDNNGMWHATNVTQANAQGYYDRDGAWVNGAPNGHYDGQGRWVSANTNAQASGYYDRNGRYVPVSASGYYDTNDQWVAGAASGYYDRNGRWVAGPAVGRYDANGRWMPGQASGRRDANGVWIADAQPGYYDNGRWISGQAQGYYDTQGRWIATAPFVGGQATNASYESRGGWGEASADIRSRQAWLDQRIRRGLNDGSLTRMEADRALRELAMIRRQEAGMRRYRGQLGPRDTVTIQARLDTLRQSIRWARNNDDRNSNDRDDNGQRRY